MAARLSPPRSGVSVKPGATAPILIPREASCGATLRTKPITACLVSV